MIFLKFKFFLIESLMLDYDVVMLC